MTRISLQIIRYNLVWGSLRVITRCVVNATNAPALSQSFKAMFNLLIFDTARIWTRNLPLVMLARHWFCHQSFHVNLNFSGLLIMVSISLYILILHCNPYLHQRPCLWIYTVAGHFHIFQHFWPISSWEDFNISLHIYRYM
jgi:hypothetical protein